MATTFYTDFESRPESLDTADAHVVHAEGQSHIALPDGMSVSALDLGQDGADLILTAPDGQTLIIESYFNADPTPLLDAADGGTLTPDLVDSFSHQSGLLQYAQTYTLNDVSPVGAVEELSGHATVTRTDGSQEPLAAGSPIYQGDVVETAADGAVNIIFADESSFAISEDARMAIDEFVYDPSSESGSSDFSVLRGVFVYTSGLIGRDDPDDVEIDTPVGSIGIRGTTIAGHINPDGDSTVTVTEGAIVIRNGAGEVTLSERFATAQLNSFNTAPQSVGVLDVQAMGQTYNVLRTVAPNFFTAIGDNGEGQAPGEDAAPGEGGAEGADAAGEASAPEETGADSENTEGDDGGEEAAEANSDGAEDGGEAEAETADDGAEVEAEAPAEDGTVPGTEPLPADGDAFSGDSSFDAASETTPPSDPVNTAGTTDPLASDPVAADPVSSIDPVTTDSATDTSSTTTTSDVYDPAAYDTAPTLPPLQLLLYVSNALKDGLELNAGDVVATIQTTEPFDLVYFALANIPKNLNGDPYYELVDADTNDNSAQLVLTAAGKIVADAELLTKAAFESMDIGAVLADGRSVHATAQQIIDATLNFHTFNALNLNGINGAEGFAVTGASGTGEHLGTTVDAFTTVTILAGTDTLTGGNTYQINANGTFSTLSVPLAATGGSRDMAVVGDTNIDGTVEYIIGAPYFDNASDVDSGAVMLTNGGVVDYGYGIGDYYGASVDGAGDVNGDGRDDLLIGAPGADNGGTDRGVAYLNVNGTDYTLSGSGANSALFGTDVRGIGDIDNDGYTDVLVSAPGENMAYLYKGGLTFDTGADISFTGINIDPAGNDIPLFDLGDVNGDGISDFAIVETGRNIDADSDLEGMMHVFMGGAAFGTTIDLATDTDSNGVPDDVAALGGFTLTYSGDGIITGAGSAGDFNGDGYDDIAIAVHNGDIADVFVLYGHDGLAGSLVDVNTLFGQPDQAFHIVYDLTEGGLYTAPTDFDFEFGGGSDMNGDGFEDLIIGTPNAGGGDGAVYVVNGRAIDDGTGPVGADGAIMHISYETNLDANDNPALYNGLSSVIANENGAHLVGSEQADHLSDEGKTVVSMQAGAGDDILEINNTDPFAADTRDMLNLANIDGGDGYDILQFFSDGTQVDILDFSNVGSEGIKGIEEFQIMNDGGLLKLGLDDIFRLMKESDDGTLKITDMTNGDGSGPTTFTIDSNGSGTYLVDELGFTNNGTINEGSVTYNAYGYGSYQLLIDQNVDTQPAAVV